MTQLKPWGEEEKSKWFQEQTIQRSYLEEVVAKIIKLSDRFEVSSYGALSLNPKLYPLYMIKSKKFNPLLKTVLISGGVHGYETSGVHGALSFMETKAKDLETHFNFICTPCISPWAYETINRWNNKAIDPNRSFVENSPSEECALFLKAIVPYKNSLYVHFDLHETTDTDNSVFRPAKALRDGVPEEEFSEIPDGFYTVGDTENPCEEFQRAIIDSVKEVTHIAPPDDKGNIIGERIQQEGVINYPLKKLSLCAGFSDARFTTTTEVYPDSPKVTPEECVQAQVAAVSGGLGYLLKSVL